MHRFNCRSRSGTLLAGAAAIMVVLAFAACTSGDDSDEEVAAASDTGAPATETAATESAEPEYEGLPADLTSQEVCDLLDDATVEGHLASEITNIEPMSHIPACQWFYKLTDGPVTNMQVQVMSMDQTSERLGTEALEWGLSWAPNDVEIREIDGLDIPNGSYEFGEGVVVFAIDPVGRLITVTTHSETSGEARVALVRDVVAALTGNHT